MSIVLVSVVLLIKGQAIGYEEGEPETKRPPQQPIPSLHISSSHLLEPLSASNRALRNTTRVESLGGLGQMHVTLCGRQVVWGIMWQYVAGRWQYVAEYGREVAA